jgi:hypothetical protein
VGDGIVLAVRCTVTARHSLGVGAVRIGVLGTRVVCTGKVGTGKLQRGRESNTAHVKEQAAWWNSASGPAQFVNPTVFLFFQTDPNL